MPVNAQQIPPNFRDAIDYPSLLQQMHSADVSERAVGFYSLLFDSTKGDYDAKGRVRRLLAARPKLAAGIQQALIAALVTEHREAPARKTQLPKLYAQYPLHLIDAVSAFADPSAKAALTAASNSRDPLIAKAARDALGNR